MPYAVALLNIPLRSKSETSSGADSSASRTRRERSVVRPVGVGSDPSGWHYHWPIHVRPRPPRGRHLDRKLHRKYHRNQIDSGKRLLVEYGAGSGGRGGLVWPRFFGVGL